MIEQIMTLAACPIYVPRTIPISVAAVIQGQRAYDPDQAWFWTPEWQVGEREAAQDIEAGRVEAFDSAEDFLASFPD